MSLPSLSEWIKRVLANVISRVELEFMEEIGKLPSKDGPLLDHFPP
jgi:hypothetical protein